MTIKEYIAQRKLQIIDEVKVLDVVDSMSSAERYMVAMARLTQRAHKISNMSDFVALLDRPYSVETVETMAKLPHPTIQKFGLINIAVVGASRRFLAQITRHQNEIKFMSGSLQYSDYSDMAQFCVPYEVTKWDAEHPEQHGAARRSYLSACADAMDDYKNAVPYIGNDAAGYMAPQGMRNVLFMSVLPFELKHIISQRSCNRNTLETQYVMLKIWEQLYDWPMFKDCGPGCMQDGCKEGKMSCEHGLAACKSPTDILKRQFKYLYTEET